MLKNKNVVLGITGGIAAYKAAELTRELVKREAGVKVIMTGNAVRFIAPLTLQTLSGNPVYSDMFSLAGDPEIPHISLAQTADIIVIAPATANIIGKIASGIADDLLSTTIIATKAPVLICPAMNSNMYDNPILRSNIDKLSSLGYLFVNAGYGELACKSQGPGRLPDPGDIAEEVEVLLTEKDLGGHRILITAGPTRESFDPVRYISNHSSGKMGYALAIMARRRGADVTLISGPTALSIPAGVRFVGVSSAEEMRDAVMEHLEDSTVIIKAAAVADYRPSTASDSKIKKKDGVLDVHLEKTPDIISEVSDRKGDRILVGFAMETENLVENAKGKMIARDMDLIVANELGRPGSGFQHDTNIVKIIDKSGNIEELPLMDKKDVADRILDRILEISGRRGGK
ncbi:MAG: bifunctional phosphopantothenoylcysteine decarboxylase/phosphopantothenate--cysteine ligase CoaBC [Thermodesulfobacteriota bacterium]|nr:bifunctional phosphopantothenoylcysteine decarboxylase/phosphopantothenate--cysteine ligase CoaBC [Thermodesulfobacteriota bacterium]